MREVHIYGILPPPTGGNSVHNERFLRYVSERNMPIEFFKANPGGNGKTRSFLFLRFFSRQLNWKRRILQITGFGPTKRQLCLLLLMICFNKKLIVRIANDRFSDEYVQRGFFRRLVAKLYFRRVSHVIFVNPNSNRLFIKSSKTSVVPGFLPPSQAEMEIGSLPGSFHDVRKEHRLLLTANAYTTAFYKGEDLYGIDLSIDLMKKLMEEGFDDVGFVYVISEIGDDRYFRRMLQRVEEFGLTRHFYFYNEPVCYSAVINLCDVFIRPTNTDGDANSVREALSIGRPVIASNCVCRPEGVVLFENRNGNDLYAKVTGVIKNCQEHKQVLSCPDLEDNAQKIIDIYNRVLP
jgi:glycosyltransferase involved in cell wall biosynthesis